MLKDSIQGYVDDVMRDLVSSYIDNPTEDNSNSIDAFVKHLKNL